MELTQFIDNLDALAATIRREFQRAVIIAANDIASAVSLRVVHQGENANGQKFTPYSSNKQYASSFKKKGRNASSDAKISALGRGAKITYGEFRVMEGLNASPKNFEFTGEMWRKFGVQNVSDTGGQIVVNIGGTTADAAAKIRHQTKREGVEITRANDAEIQIVNQNLTKWLAKIKAQHNL